MSRIRLALTGAALVAAHAALAGALPVRQGDAYVYPDGTRVRATDPSGRAGEVRRDGSIRYSDGTTVSHDARIGDTKMMRGDGRVDTIPGNAPRRGEDGNFVFSDGTRIRGTDPSGQPGKVMADGSISYADGTRASHDSRTGDTKFVSPDGTVRLINGRTGTDKTTRGTGAHENTSRDNKERSGSARPGGNDNRSQDNKQSNSNTGSGKNDNSNKGDAGGKNDNSTKADAGSKADKAGAEKGGKEKGRMVQDDGAGGSRGPRITMGGLATNPSPDESRGGGQPKLLKPGGSAGPGMRGGDGPRTPGALLTLPANSLVVNPGPNTPGGGGSRTPIDPFGGKR